MAADYLLWFVPAMALQFGLIGMGAALRGTGNFKPGMVVQTATVILNIVLAPVFIFGWLGAPAMGVVGAAIATLIAIVVGVVWMATYFLSRTSFLKFVAAEWAPRSRLWVEMLKIGLPAGAEFALMAVYLMLVYVVSRPFGAAAQAGFGIGQRDAAGELPAGGCAGLRRRPGGGPELRRPQGRSCREATFTSAASMAAGVMLVLSTITWLAAAWFIRIFSSDPAVVAVGEEYLHIVCLQLRGVWRDLRQLQHVPGDGQHRAGAGDLGHAHDPHQCAGAVAVGPTRLPDEVGVVHLGRRRLRAAGTEPVAAAARVPPSPAVRWEPAPLAAPALQSESTPA